ncbi:MAG TPA: YihY/virulence factor BrkB family protein [Candidatus Limnocylindrales bacterium]
MNAIKAEAPTVVERPVSLATTLWQRAREHDLTGLSAEMAYRFLFALFPFALFMASVAASVAGVLGFGDPTGRIIDGLGDNLPPDLAGTVRQELETVLGQQRPGVATIGALVALWAATTGTMTVIKAMNRTYDVTEDRSLLRRYLLGIGLTVAGSIGIVIAFVTIVGGALLTEQVVGQLGLEGSWAAITLLRWPLVFGLLVLAATIVYRVGPNLTPSWRTAATGAIVFAIGWLVATGVFALYVANIANYGATYGALGAVMVLMVWLYLTGLVLLVGAEIVAIRVHRTEPERIDERRAEIAARAEAVAIEVVDRSREVADRTLGGLRRSARGTASDVDRRGAAPR